MKRIFLVFISISLHADISLSQYIDLTLGQSYEALNLEDKSTLAKLDSITAEHQYDVITSPVSSVGFDETGSALSLGIQSSKRNTFGGEIYSSLISSKTSSSSLKNNSYSTVHHLGYRQSLFRKFGFEYNTLALYNAKEQEKSVSIGIEESRKKLILEAILKYYNVILSRKQIEIYKASKKRALHNFNSAKAKQEAGIVSKVDVHRAKLSYLNAEKNMYDALRSYQSRLSEAYFLINMEQEEDLFNSPITRIYYEFKSYMLDEVLIETPEWRQLLIDEKVLNRQIYNAKKDILPDIQMNIQYSSYNRSNQFNQSWKFKQHDWSLNFSSNYSFDTHKEKVALERLKVQKNKLFLEKQRIYRMIKKDIVEQMNTFENIKLNLEIEKLKEEEAQESLTVAQIRYDRGLSSNLDVLDAESNLLNAQISSISVLVKYNHAIFQLAHRLNLLDMDFVEKVIE